MSNSTAEIRVLPLDVVNQIAAGEVVERPAHLIKELIENSIDAGSTEILIDVKKDVRHILVKDNGRGIHKDELALALQRHATSKIEASEDLFRLSSYGFRGEALASIASVSRLTLISRKLGEKKSYQIHSDYGELSKVEDGSIAQGTEIFVQALFENTPARLKFLKSAPSELGQIKNVIKAMALSHPYVQLKLLVEGDLQLLYMAVREGDTDALERRYKEILNVKKIFLAAKEREFLGEHKIKCEVAFTAPNEVAKTSKNIWVFVQNRWVQDRTITAALMDSFRTLLMHGEYPQVALFISTPADFVDVNISPTKSQVKFINSSDIYRTVQASLRDALAESPWFREQLRGGPSEQAIESRDNYKHQGAPQKFYSGGREPATARFFNDEGTTLKIKDFERLQPIVNQESVEHRSESQAGPLQNNPNQTPAAASRYWSSFHVVGQFDLTYIVCQKDDELILVDQHAAHERVAFEKLMQKWKGGALDLQSFLFPLQIQMGEAKVEALLFHQEDLLKMGLEIERMGPESIGVKSAPLIIKEGALTSALEKMAHDFVEYGDSHQLEKSIADLFATMACHSVIRAGQSLSIAEMQELLSEMDQFAFSSFCPHGRPVSIAWTTHEVERLFGRRN
jgi:DNA mismatch repair protein MutL